MTRLPHWLLLTFFLATACANSAEKDPAQQAPEETAAQVQSTPAGTDKPVLLFFLNPHGRPCQMQRDILQQSKELTDRATLKLVQTNVNADQRLFYRYGIRALPTLLVTDAGGAELHRFSPGIHQSDEIMRVLTQLR